MANLYEVLGVSQDASKEEIRSAYRSRTATASGSDRVLMNRAWNVLSDGYQRENYDQSLADGTAEDVIAPDLPAPRTASGSRSAAPAGDKRSARLEQRQRAMEARAEAMKKRFPPLPLPDGMQPAAPKPRFMALAIDAALLMLLLIGAVYALTSTATPLTAAEQSKVENLECVQHVANAEIAYLDDKKPSKSETLDKQCKEQLAAIDSEALKAMEAKPAKAAKKAAEKRNDDAAESIKKLQPKMNTTQIAIVIGATVASLALFVIPALGTGQTIGKRIKKVMIRTTSGDIPAASTLIRRYFPVAFAVGSFLVLGVIGQLVLIGVMFTGTNWSNNPNLQSTLDRWCKTWVLQRTSDIA